MEKLTLDINELSYLLGISKTTLYTMVQNEEIPYAKLRGRILFHYPTVDEWIKNGGSKKSNN